MNLTASLIKEIEADIERCNQHTAREGSRAFYKDDTTYTLIAYAFKPGNEDIRDNLLVVLYDKDKESFLKCFKKSEKSPQKSLESADFRGFSIFPCEEGHERSVS